MKNVETTMNDAKGNPITPVNVELVDEGGTIYEGATSWKQALRYLSTDAVTIKVIAGIPGLTYPTLRIYFA